MRDGPSKRTQRLLEKMAALPAAEDPAVAPTASPAEHGQPGLLREFNRLDNESLRRLRDLEAKYANGAALPCLMLDPASVSTGDFFNRLEDAFDPEADPSFRALMESVQRTGGNQDPGLVRPHLGAAQPYQLIYGERRLRACRILGLPFKAVVATVDDEAVAQLHSLENSLRENPSPVELALQLESWFTRLGLATYGDGETTAVVGRIFGYSSRHARRLRMIAQVPTDVWPHIPAARKLSVRQSLALAAAWKADPQGVRDRLKSLPANLLPKQVIAALTNTPVASAAPTNQKSITLTWPADAKTAKELTAQLKALEKKFGITLKVT